MRGLYGSFPKLGVLLWDPQNKDYHIFGSILGSPCLGKVPIKSNCGLGILVQSTQGPRGSAEEQGICLFGVKMGVSQNAGAMMITRGL